MNNEVQNKSKKSLTSLGSIFNQAEIGSSASSLFDEETNSIANCSSKDARPSELTKKSKKMNDTNLKNNIVLTNSIIEKALTLRDEVFRDYIFIITVLNCGTNPAQSMHYGHNVKALFDLAVEFLGYDKTYKTFRTNFNKLTGYGLIRVGEHRTKYFDTLHRVQKFDPAKKNYWTDFSFYELRQAIRDMSGTGLKVYIKSKILGEKKDKRVRRQSAKYVRMTFGVSDRNKIYQIKKNTFNTLGVLINEPLELPTNLAFARNSKRSTSKKNTFNTQIKTSAKIIKTSVVARTTDFDFLDFFDLKDFNTMNKIRRTEIKPNIELAAFKNSAQQFVYAYENGLIEEPVKDKKKYFMHHMINFDMYLIKDERELSNFYTQRAINNENKRSPKKRDLRPVQVGIKPNKSVKDALSTTSLSDDEVNEALSKLSKLL